MLRWRVVSLATTVGLLVGGGAAIRAAGGAGEVAPVLVSARRPAAKVLEIFYTPPVLVAAGESVRVPVDVVCATAEGHACGARVTVGARADGDRGWQVRTVPASKGMSMDLSAPAARAARSGGAVAFWLRARAGTRSISLGSPSAPLRFFVVRRLPVVRVPAVTFGDVRDGRSVVSLPWGSGSTRAGLIPGNESPTLGPSAFDVDGRGRVALADGAQGRLAVFIGGRLIRQVPMALGPVADLALGAGGSAFVADRESGRVSVRSVGPSGAAGPAGSLGAGLISGIQVVAGRPFVNVLPADQWITPRSTSGATAVPTTGMPTTADGAQLLRVGTERSVRLGLVRNGVVRGAVDLRSDVRFGDVALAAVDRLGRYVVVVRTWRGGDRPVDQYQAMVIRDGAVERTFGIPDVAFADTPPLSRFRLGADGALYQLRTTPAGVVVVRYELGGEAR